MQTGSEIVGDYKIKFLIKNIIGIVWLLSAMVLALLFMMMPTNPRICWQMMLILLIFYVGLIYAPRFFYNGEKESELYITAFLKQCASEEKITIKYARLD